VIRPTGTTRHARMLSRLEAEQHLGLVQLPKMSYAASARHASLLIPRLSMSVFRLGRTQNKTMLSSTDAIAYQLRYR